MDLDGSLILWPRKRKKELWMLRLEKIRKSYKTADFFQVALDDVSIAFRENEFAAILGPSGSGKTTLLNIIGGLDQYDSGELEIDDISTKQYKDKDWDIYRNNRIGFVFQNYNLIPHQSIFTNVELALSLAGMEKATRKRRVRRVLKEVGLLEHANKRPNQLSGGQMQRVAIARALVNSPDILLADEPTGALDTVTSMQIMDLLTQIAKDRLVIMVTHNKELAQEYASRLVLLKDGKVIADNNPYTPDDDEIRPKKELNKTKMSFRTALSLSFSNLMTKKGRTLITALAGSIGIIGIASIIALANGVNTHIGRIEEETLSMYPLSVQRTGFDVGGIFGGGIDSGEATQNQGQSNSDGMSLVELFENQGLIQEGQMLNNTLAFRNTNDLLSLREYLEANEAVLEPLVSSIHYAFDITPQIFLGDTDHGIVQVHPDPLLAGIGLAGIEEVFGIDGFISSAFNELVSRDDRITSLYDLLVGEWPTRYDEVLLVLTPQGRVSDITLYAMGLLDREALKEKLEAGQNGEDLTIESERSVEYFSYEELLGVEFRVLGQFEQFYYDETFNVWVDRSEDKDFMRALLEDGINLRVAGIVRPVPNAAAVPLSIGINYTPELTAHLMDLAAQAPIVRSQLASPELNVMTGRSFAEEEEGSRFDFSRIISVDEEMIREAFMVEVNGEQLEVGGGQLDIELSEVYFDEPTLQLELPEIEEITIELSEIDLPPFELDDVFDKVAEEIAEEIELPTEELSRIIVNVLREFIEEIVLSGERDPEVIVTLLEEYLEREEVQESLSNQIEEAFAGEEIEEQIQQIVQRAIEDAIQDYMEEAAEIIQDEIQLQIEREVDRVINETSDNVSDNIADQLGQLTIQIENVVGQMEGQMDGLLSLIQGEMELAINEILEEIEEQLGIQIDEVDLSSLEEAFQITIGEEEIFQLMSTILHPAMNSYERNLALLGYARLDHPVQILIFPRSFAAKQEIIGILERYNERMEESGQPEKMIFYTDLVGVLMTSVTDIINMVSNALIVFVAVSLLVSSIMIGVITYISVLERRKEIGILRAIGASKNNVRQVFNAETLIVGFAAGVLGVTFALLMAESVNLVVYNRIGIERIARLPAEMAVVLIGVSMLLTYIAGWLPASAAAKKNPIEALRSE